MADLTDRYGGAWRIAATAAFYWVTVIVVVWGTPFVQGLYATALFVASLAVFLMLRRKRAHSSEGQP